MLPLPMLRQPEPIQLGYAFIFLVRVNLNWDEKIFVEANLRADASSRFAKKYRWGYFPSFSLGWRMEQEAFMKDISWLTS